MQMLEEAKQKDTLEAFITKAINEYNIAELKDLESIYDGENIELKNLKIKVHVGEGGGIDLTPKRKKFSDYGKIIVNHAVSRLHDNPVQISLSNHAKDEAIEQTEARIKDDKDILVDIMGEDFDLHEQGRWAAKHGVVWVYALDNTIFKATEFIPLIDDWDGEIRAGIRFWQMGNNKDAVQYVQLYEMEGITNWKRDGDKLTPLDGTRERNEVQTLVQIPYSFNVDRTRGDGIEISRTPRRLDAFPVVPRYFNPSRKSEYSRAIREVITYSEIKDTVYSDRSVREPNVRYTITGYGGDLKSIAQMVQVSEATGWVADRKLEDGAKVDVQAFELPHMSHEKAMSMSREALFMWAELSDPDRITGAGLREIAVRLTMAREDAKMVGVEKEVRKFLIKYLAVHGLQAESIIFKHKKPSDDQQTAKIITQMLPDLPFKYRVKLCPSIPAEMHTEIIEYQEAWEIGQAEEDIKAYELHKAKLALEEQKVNLRLKQKEAREAQITLLSDKSGED